MRLPDIAVDNNRTAHAEGLRPDVPSLLRNFLAREDEIDSVRLEVSEPVSLEPDDGRAVLVAETKRTPNGGQFDYLHLSLFETLLPDDSGQF